MKSMIKQTAITFSLFATGLLPTLLLPATPALAASHQFVRAQSGIQEYQLDNGLKVLLVENHAAPVVSVNIVYRVGSRNEAVGYTGSTHFLEHMLFKGTPTYNKAQGTQIAQTLLAQGARFNATTWLDRTNYFETLPSNQLELALKMEADRMRNSFIADEDRQSEMSVVRNELERGENNPGRVMWQNMFSHAFKSHPYRTPTIGWRTDVEGVPTSRLKKFYQDFYYPNNATLIVVGDFQPQAALKMVEQTFGKIAPSPEPIPEIYTQEAPQEGENRFVLNRPGQLGIVNIGYHVPPLAHTDSAALDVLNGILSAGVSSRLHQALVEKGLAVSADAWNGQLRDPGLFILTTELASGTTHQEAEKQMLATLDALKKTAPSAEDVKRVKNQILARFAFDSHGTHELASALSEYEAMAEWRYLVTYPERIQSVTPADVQRVAQKYFQPQNRTVGWFVPEKTTAVNVLERNLSYPQGQNKPPQAAASQSTATPTRTLPFAKNARLIVQENHLDNTVALEANLRAGSIQDPVGKAGLAELTAAMLERGTQKDNKLALAKKLEAMGSELNFGTELERVSVSGRMLSEHLPETLALLFDMLKTPAFNPEEFDKLKKQSLDQLKKRLDNTDALAGELLSASLYPATHPHALSTETRIAQMEKLSLEDVKAFYKAHYGSNQMILTVVGDVKTTDVHQQVKQALNNWKADNPAEVIIPDVPQQTRGQQANKNLPDKANVSIAMGVQAGIKLGDPDYFPALIANHALGQSSLSSRLGLRVRDELGLTYGIYSYFAKVGLGAGPWLVGVTTNPQNIDKTLAATREVIARYRQEGISDKEFEQAKSSLIGSYLVSLSTNPQIADRLTDAAFYGLGENYLTERAKLIEKVSKEQVNRMIQQYFDPERLSIAIVGTLPAASGVK